MDQIILQNDERLDDLQLDGLKIIQKQKGYGFTSDSVLLANFVKTKHNDICLEIGTGCGIISILVEHKEKPKKIYAFEMQKNQAILAQKNIELCEKQNAICVINDKIQNWQKYLPAGSIDVIFANPPYFKYDQNICGNCQEKVLSRFDKELPLNEFFGVCGKLLKFGGKLYFVCDSARLAECILQMKQFGICIKQMYFVHPNQNKNSTVFLCQATLGGKEDLKILPPLFTNNLDGDYIQTIQKLYKK